MDKIFSIKNLEVKHIVRNELVHALRGVSFDIYANEFIAIVGESGSGRSTFIKSIANIIDQNSWISNGSIIFYPPRNEKMDGKVDKQIDLVEFHQQNLAKHTIYQIKNYFKNYQKKIINEIKLIETLSVEKAFKIEEKLSKKLDKILIKNFDENNGKYRFKISNYVEQIKKWRRFVFLQNNEEEKTKHLDSLINKIEKAKIEQVRIQNINFFKKRFLRKFINIIYKCHEEDIKWNDNQIYKYNLYFQKLDYLNDFEKILQNIIEKQLNNKKATVSEMTKLRYKAEIELNSFAKRRMRNYLIHSKWQGPTVGIVFQSAKDSLKPSISIGSQMVEVIRNSSDISKSEAKLMAIELLKEVELKKPEKSFRMHPQSFSSSDLQRINIAIALANRPKVLILDEPILKVRQIDRSNILNLIYKIKEKYRMTIILVVSDIRYAFNFTDRIAIMYAGQIVEFGKSKEILTNSQHPYTWSFLQSLPELNKDGKFKVKGFAPNLTQEIVGDPFAPRNEYALSIDWIYEPPFFKITDSHYAKTWLLDYRSPKIDRPKQLEQIAQFLLEKEDDSYGK